MTEAVVPASSQTVHMERESFPTGIDSVSAGQISFAKAETASKSAAS